MHRTIASCRSLYLLHIHQCVRPHGMDICLVLCIPPSYQYFFEKNTTPLGCPAWSCVRHVDVNALEPHTTRTRDTFGSTDFGRLLSVILQAIKRSTVRLDIFSCAYVFIVPVLSRSFRSSGVSQHVLCPAVPEFLRNINEAPVSRDYLVLVIRGH